MLSPRVLAVSVALPFVLSSVGCTHSNAKANQSSATDTASVPSSTTSSMRTSTSPAETSTAAVPIDQIPPGHPASWVPAGVPTTAPYREPGDTLPKFTLAMFVNNQAGALAAAHYYLEARRWAYATMSATPFLAICDSSGCKMDVPFYTDGRSTGRHVVGARRVASGVRIVAAPERIHAEWIIQVTVTIARGNLVDKQGKVLKTQVPRTEITNLHLAWKTKMWRVVADALA
jgi:hypothetical protein